MSFGLEMALATDRGRVRSANEDAIVAEPRLGYAILADGLGGHQAGEVASRTAVDVISATLEAELEPHGDHAISEAAARDLLASAIAAANSAVYQAARSHADRAGMGTTVVVALWRGERVVAGHVGDSRLYRMRSKRLLQLTRDHSLAQEQVDRGVLPAGEAQHAAGRGYVTRAVGLEPEVQSEVRSFDSQRADIYLLCSDGLTDMLSEREIEAVLADGLTELQHGAKALVDAANHKGGRDNISVVLARLQDAQAPA